MARPIEETTAWVAEIMAKKSGVTGVEQLSNRSIKVSRRDYPPYVAGIIAKSDVTHEDVDEVVATDPSVDILVNVPAQGIWRGSGITAANVAGLAFGGIGDLQSCIDN